MDNGFNNENMNQFQNNNFNNGYVNNQNNKNDKWKNVLIGIMAIIIIGLSALTIYVLIDKKDNNLDENKDNNIQEENKDNNANNIPEKDHAKLEQKVLDEYYLKTTDIIDEHVQKYRYSALSDDETIENYLKVSYDEFYKAYTVQNIVNMMEPINGVGDCENSVSHINDEYDNNGVKYPKYCTEDTPFYDCVEEYAKAFGLTVDEISKMDKSIWNLPCCGGFCDKLYDVNELKLKYSDIYNNLFDSSFSVSLDNRIYGVIGAYSYDKNIDKIISHGTGGTASFYEIVILESKEENNLYKVKFVEGTFSPGGKWMSLDIDSNEDISDESEAKSVVKRNKNKLPNYEVIFEKVSTGYKFKEINKVS